MAAALNPSEGDSGSAPRQAHAALDLSNMEGEVEHRENAPEQLDDVEEPPPLYERPPWYNSWLHDFYNGNIAVPDDPEEQGILREIVLLIDEPLSRKERKETQRRFETRQGSYQPGRLYWVEARAERLLIARFKEIDPEFELLFLGPAGLLRENIFIRHRIRKRWENFGVWNAAWGIPGRQEELPEDKLASWRWAWEGDTPPNGYDEQTKSVQADHPNTRAMELRGQLCRGQRGPPPPRSNLAPDASKSQAEAFIISRPWYNWRLDLEEEHTRLERVPLEYRQQYGLEAPKVLGMRWMHRGEWWPHKETFRLWPGNWWKWAHESPPPAPVDLYDMDLSPYEAEAFEAVLPPSPMRLQLPGYESEESDPPWETSHCS